ncbi:hypothetical protein D3C77_444590 [compost metagenome]
MDMEEGGDSHHVSGQILQGYIEYFQADSARDLGKIAAGYPDPLIPIGNQNITAASKTTEIVAKARDEPVIS